jgi:aryl-alcohol dehydrogenase-like predicted oxidoreductase
MRCVRLGQSGLLVSELCLGTMTFGREADEQASRDMIQRFLAAGGNFIDTADIYSAGVSEEITGRAIRGRRDEIVLATKVHGKMGEGPNDAGLSRKHILKAVQDSLRRLGTDYIDLYQCHAWDAATSIQETLETLSDLVHAGKVRYIGCSNFTGWHIMLSGCVSEARRLEHFVSLQPQYSLVERSIEYEVVPACVQQGVGIIPWGPLGGGFLSGKYRRGERPPEGSRIAGADESWEEAWQRRATEKNWQILDVVGGIAEETGKTYAQIALNWLLRQPAVVAPIIGARTVHQLEDNLGAVGWELTPEQVQRLDTVSAPLSLYPYRWR